MFRDKNMYLTGKQKRELLFDSWITVLKVGPLFFLWVLFYVFSNPEPFKPGRAERKVITLLYTFGKGENFIDLLRKQGINVKHDEIYIDLKDGDTERFNTSVLGDSLISKKIKRLNKQIIKIEEQQNKSRECLACEKIDKVYLDEVI